MLSAIKRFYNPVLFQGSLSRRRYFEGWYFKHVSADRRSVFAFIPGVSLSGPSSHAFVQMIEGTTGSTRYFPYPLDAFQAARDRFEIAIGASHFSLSGIEVHVRDTAGAIDARLEYSGITPFPSRPLSPGIMGPYAFAPFMECYHGIGSLDHRVDGEVRASGGPVGFAGGSGYIEKDWGRSMPQAWVWCQSNTFDVPGTCLLFSIARIPWLGRSFPGFFAVLLEGGRIHRFASYTGARLTRFVVAGREVQADIQGRHSTLSLSGLRSHEGVLMAPVDGAMDRRIGESIDARVAVRLKDPAGRVLFEGRGECAGLEIVGDPALLMPFRSPPRS